MITSGCAARPVEEAGAELGKDSQVQAPVRYASLESVYTAASRLINAAGSSSVMSKKVRARKLTADCLEGQDYAKKPVMDQKLRIVRVYSRRGTRGPRPSFYDFLLARKDSGPMEAAVKNEVSEFDPYNRSISEEEIGQYQGVKRKRRRMGSGELVKLGRDSNPFCGLDGPRLRDYQNSSTCNGNHAKVTLKKKNGLAKNSQNVLSGSASTKRWVRLSFDGADPKTFIGLQCKVFWPLDADWYTGCVVGYDFETKRHRVKYQDGDEENLILWREKIKFHISREEMERLHLRFYTNSKDADDHDYDEMVVMAASLDECQDFDPGDIIWAKLTGHAMWPAIVVNEACIGERKGLKKMSSGKSVLVQFFGTHDFARIKVKQVNSFLKGLLCSFHLKCKQPKFARSLEEAKMYLSEHKLPARMLQQQNGVCVEDSESMSSSDEGSQDSGGDCMGGGEVWLKPGGLETYQHIVGDLKIVNLGKIVMDSRFFKDDRFIWPEGYTVLRKFKSLKDANMHALYKMEVLRDAESKMRPLFRVTADTGEQFTGSTPSACWNKIYSKIRKLKNNATDAPDIEEGRIYKSGVDMFGFSDPEVAKLIQGLLKSRPSSKFSAYKHGFKRYQDLPAGYRPVRVDWKDLDKCSVCHMEEEYENNLFLQCDKCRMMVHARCYGELEPRDGVLWLCSLCRPGAPDTPPPCCLCPVIGGAMKPTTDGRWAHLACAIWIPETCLSDVKRMEPIDGISRVSKDRWKLLCSICGVSYGACIQCSNNNCRVAYHPLCARAAGLCVELEDEERHHLLAVDDDDTHHCIRLLSFCKRHRQSSNDRSQPDEQIAPISRRCSDFIPPSNPSGSARTEPYNHFGRRGRKEPEALVAASVKRLFVENQPYVVGGFSQLAYRSLKDSNFSLRLHGSKIASVDSACDILTMAEKYKYMKETFRKRLAFGKSGIHGFGIFAKLPHRAGDMVIEYTGELVRPSIADRREHLIYNSLVGAGTYMFRIDNERVIDATRAGSIAHLINHSCEPNCYSRVISVNGDEHIVIFAKRDIERWEELTYDYRFFSIDERLACYCGFPRCRGIVNDTEAEEQVANIRASRSELRDWTEE